MFRKIALTAAALAVIAGAGMTANTQQAEAKVHFNIGIGHGGHWGHGGHGWGHGRGWRARYGYGYRRCFRKRGHRVKFWHNGHGHFHKRWVRGRVVCRRY